MDIAHAPAPPCNAWPTARKAPRLPPCSRAAPRLRRTRHVVIHVVEAMLLMALAGVAVLAIRLSARAHLHRLAARQDRVEPPGPARRRRGGARADLPDARFAGRRAGLPRPDAQGPLRPHGPDRAARAGRRRSFRRCLRLGQGATARSSTISGPSSGSLPTARCRSPQPAASRPRRSRCRPAAPGWKA